MTNLIARSTALAAAALLGLWPPAPNASATEASAEPMPKAAAKPAKPMPKAAAEPMPLKIQPQSYLRVVDGEDDRIRLEIATREFVPIDGKGPRVALVAVAHIGERAFYRDVQRVLDQYDVVLYESVLPPGARGPGGDDDVQRAESTRTAMHFVGSLIEGYAQARRAYPDDLANLRGHLALQDERLVGWQRAAAVDAWGQPLRYEVRRNTEDHRAVGYELTSLGSDLVAGGTGHAADLVVTSRDGIDPLEMEKTDNIQAQLASTLGLAFQLEAIDYAQPSWRCSDMAMDEVARELSNRGIEFQPLAGALTGSSLPARMLSGLLRIVRMADLFLGGVIADTGKVALIEMLGNDEIMDQALDDMGEGFSEVIVGLRNQVAVDDLQQVVEHEPTVESVGIFYGAAHMTDLERRLAGIGYRPATADESPSSVQWLRAIEVDLTTSVVTRRDLEQMRAMMRQMVR